MSDIVLILGPIAFQEFELPSGINFGGRQILAVHRLPGGTRIIDAVGRDDSLISFEGIFTGSNATLRARTLDALRVAGIPLQLNWDVFFYTVLIAEFAADYQNGWWIPYRIVCTVLQDEASIIASAAVSLTAAVLADVASAAQLVPDTNIGLSGFATPFTAPNTAIRGTESYGAAMSGLASARSTIGTSIYAANRMVCTSDFGTPSSAQCGADTLLAATDAMGQLATLTIANNYLARAAVNLGNASS